MNGVLTLKWSIPLQEGDSYGHLKCHRARVKRDMDFGQPQARRSYPERAGQAGGERSRIAEDRHG
eukprot:3337805-Heterocapsa_arctica.AAC.1